MPTLDPHPSDGPVEILLVEDNPGDVHLVREALKTTESRVAMRTVADGNAAIDRLKELAADDPDALPDVALVDLDLPGKDGHEVLETIRDDPKLRLLPVIVLTGSDERGDIERCYDAHVNAYLTKPTDIDGFESLVETIERFWFEQARLPPLA